MPDNVTSIGAHRRKRGGNAGNMKCDCGSEWWQVRAVIDAGSRQITSKAVQITCAECGKAKVHSW